MSVSAVHWETERMLKAKGAALNMSSFVVKQWDIFSSFVKRMQNSNMLSDSLRGTEVVTS